MKRIAALVLGVAVVASSAVVAPGVASAATTVSGTVRDAAGAPVTRGMVEFFPIEAGVVAPDAITSDYVDDRGRWQVRVADYDLPEGRYLLQASDWDTGHSGWYPAARTPETAKVLDVTTTSLTGVDITVPLPESVGGQVTGPGGQRIAGAVVTLYPSTWLPGSPLAGVAGTLQTLTDGNGQWHLESAGILPDSYLIRAGQAGLDARWFGGATAQQATRVAISAETDRNSLDIRLAELPTIAGTVTANGKRIDQMLVTAYPVDEPGPEGLPDTDSGFTDDRGNYRLAVPSGRYRLRANDPQYSLPNRWYPAAATEDAATIVTLGAGQAVSDIDINSSFQPKFPGKPRAKPKGLRPPTGLADREMDPIGNYDGQSKCQPKPKPGTVALAKLLRGRYGPETIGLSRACTKDRSEHYDGRALDWMVNSRVPGEARKGDDFVKWLTMSRGRDVGAMARRLGIMYVIWRDRIWGVYAADQGWRPYDNCMSKERNSRSWDNDCHRNHVHISMTWQGARKQTSWWRG